MKRSMGVTVSAVIAIAGSTFAAIAAVILVSVFFIRSPGTAAIPTSLLVSTSFVYFFLSAWGAISAAGLLRLRNWARISFVIFAGCLAAGSLFGAAGVTAAITLPQATPGNDVTPELLHLTLKILLVFALALLALAVWWLVYFNRKAIKSQFQATKT